MFESLTDKMSNALRNLRGLGKISESNISDALQEVYKALLSADVHFSVAKKFIENVKTICLGQNVLTDVSPGQMAIKIINDELVKLLGEDSTKLSPVRPLKVMMVGLHGSGKTTSSAKLARYLKNKGNYRPALIACDVYRPAAIDQLEALSKSIDSKFYCERDSKDVADIAQKGLKYALENASDLIVFDTAGRLQIDEPLIEEIIKLKEKINPDEIFLVADAALGQEAVNVAKKFHEAVSLTGIILTKLDGDARGGAALSMKAITGIPIKFMGIGEKVEDFDIFYPDRMAQRILGMGDVVSLVEKVQENIDQKEAERIAAKMKKADFDLEDFLSQLQQMKKMGPIGGLMKMMPGMGNIEIGDKEEGKLKQTEAIIQSMTKKERTKPEIINGSRRARIAKGSGTKVSDVNALLKQFSQMRQLMKMMKGGKMKTMMRALGGKMPGMGGGKFPF